MNKSDFKNSFESHTKEKRSQKNSKPHADKGAEYQFVKNLKSRAKEEMNSFKSRAKEKRSQKNSKPRADRGVEYQFVKNLKPYAKKERTTSNLVRKRKEVKRTRNLVQIEGHSISL